MSAPSHHCRSVYLPTLAAPLLGIDCRRFNRVCDFVWVVAWQAKLALTVGWLFPVASPYRGVCRGARFGASCLFPLFGKRILSQRLGAAAGLGPNRVFSLDHCFDNDSGCATGLDSGLPYACTPAHRRSLAIGLGASWWSIPRSHGIGSPIRYVHGPSLYNTGVGISNLRPTATASAKGRSSTHGMYNRCRCHRPQLLGRLWFLRSVGNVPAYVGFPAQPGSDRGQNRAWRAKRRSLVGEQYALGRGFSGA